MIWSQLAFSNPQIHKGQGWLSQIYKFTESQRPLGQHRLSQRKKLPGQSLPGQQGAALVLFKQLFTLLQPSLPRSSYKQYYSASHLNSKSQLLPTKLTFHQTITICLLRLKKQNHVTTQQNNWQYSLHLSKVPDVTNRVIACIKRKQVVRRNESKLCISHKHSSSFSIPCFTVACLT